MPPQFADEIWTLAETEDALLPFCDEIPIDTNAFNLPRDENTPWGTDGLRAYWQSEASTATQTKPKIGALNLRLSKLLAFAPLSDEIFDDAAALGAYLPTRLGAAIRWKTNDAILFGLGNGQPVGAFTAGTAAITIAKESGQATGTLAAANLQKMIAALPPGSFSRAVWLIGPDVLQNVLSLSFGSTPVFTPAPPNITAAPNSVVGLIGGRPAIESLHAKTFSSQGDVLLVDLLYYLAITKSGGPQMVTSMHVYFDSYAGAFRVSYRIDGAPKLTAPITPPNSSNQLSPFIQLGAR